LIIRAAVGRFVTCVTIPSLRPPQRLTMPGAWLVLSQHNLDLTGLPVTSVALAHRT